MVNLLIESILPLTLILTLLLIVHTPLLEKFGANCVYVSWLIVPSSLGLYALQINGFKNTEILSTQVAQFIVNSNDIIKSSVHLDWLTFVWMFVSFCFIAYWLVCHILLLTRLNLKVAKWDDSRSILPKRLSLYQSDYIFSPMLVGLLKQKLIIPQDFTVTYTPQQQRLILEHEICHFYRNDIYWNFVAFVFLALFWFHPLVWLAYFRFRRDQELSCDQIVLAHKNLNSRIDYCKALLVTAKISTPIAFAQLSFKKFGDKEIMYERIKHIKMNIKTSALSIVTVSMLAIAAMSSVSFAGNSTLNADDDINTNYAAKLVTRVEPEYPMFAAQHNLSGAVLLKFDIRPNGQTDNITVIKSKPSGVFDNVAMTALSHWRYKEHTQDVVSGNVVQLDFMMDQNSERVTLD